MPLKRRLKDWRKRAQKMRRVVRATPPAIRTIILLVLAAALFMGANLVYHVIRKPTEMLYPMNGVMKKSPDETWREYGALFREYSTANVSAELLAALAQNEGTGDPMAHTYWRFHLTWPPFEIYKPASSAVGMYQMTDGTFTDAARYCIRDHAVIERDAGSCLSENLYNRLLPSHAIELTAAHLDRSIAAALGSNSKATIQQRQDLAAITHLCGAGAGREFARHGFKLGVGAACGDHSAQVYVDRVDSMVKLFKRIGANR